MFSALCFVHLPLSASLTRFALNRLSDHQLISDTTTFAVPSGDQRLTGAQRHLEQELANFDPEEGQRVNILGFVGHMVPVATI